MDEVETARVLTRMVMLNLLPRTADAADSRLRAVEWSACLIDLTEVEATAAIRELGMLPREQRRQNFTPGDVAEVVYSMRRTARPSGVKALPPGPPCERCDGTGFEFLLGRSRVVRSCSACRASA